MLQEGMVASLAVQVHHEMFLAAKRNGAPNPTACVGYLQITTDRLIADYPEGSEDRARVAAYFSNKQTIRNLVNNKLKMNVKGGVPGWSHFCFWSPTRCSLTNFHLVISNNAAFDHVQEYEKEKKAATQAAQAAQLAADRLGKFNVPLAAAAEGEVGEWIQGFLADHVVITNGLAKFKTPTPELTKAIPKIMARSRLWMQQHKALQQKIADFIADVGVAASLALHI